MRLINAEKFLNDSADFFEEYDEGNAPQYAIVSHRWGKCEVTFRDTSQLNAILATKAEGYSKIRNECEQALADYTLYVWIDTCCIDKSSSAELQEAINSMF